MDWERLIRQHGDALVLFARQWCPSHAEAEETVQDALVSCWQAAVSRQDGLAIGPGYLFQAVKRKAIDRYRSATSRSRREREAAEALYGAAEEAVFQQSPQASETANEVQTAMTKLPEDQREVLIMKVWGGLTFAEIGEALEVSANTAASRYRYALGKLRTILRH